MLKKFLVLLGLSSIVFAAEAAVTPVDLLDKAVAYTKQFVDAAMPVAKQAYEIGLLTLQIDAGASLVAALLACIWFCTMTYVLYRVIKWDIWRKHHDSGFASFAALVGWGFTVLPPTIIYGFKLFSVWMWVKLFHPDLWLAHMAIEKLVR